MLGSSCGITRPGDARGAQFPLHSPPSRFAEGEEATRNCSAGRQEEVTQSLAVRQIWLCIYRNFELADQREMVVTFLCDFGKSYVL
jgi:hypothetical protein